MNRNVMIAAAAFAGLLVVFVATREDHVSEGIKHLELPGISKDAVTGLEVSGAKSFSLARKGDAWEVWDPAAPQNRYAADETAMGSVLDAITSLKATDHVSDSKERHAEYELDDAKGLHVKVLGASGALADVVLGKAAKGGGSYLRKADAEPAFITKSRLGSLLRRDVSSWRKRTLVSIKAEDFRSATVTGADGTAFTFESADGKQWQLKDGAPTPAGYRFDASAAGRLAQSVASLRAQDFVDGAKPEWDGPMGLAASHTTVAMNATDNRTLLVHVGTAGEPTAASQAQVLKSNFDAVDGAGTKDGKITVEELAAAAADANLTEEQRKAYAALKEPALFARVDTGGWTFKPADNAINQEDLDAFAKTANLVPVRVDGDAVTYLVSSWSTGQLQKSLLDYRDLSLLAFDVDKAAKLTIEAGKKVVAAKRDGVWAVLDPKTLPAGFEFEPNTVASQLNMLKNMKASRLVTDVKEAQAGLGKPTATVEVVLEDGSKQTLRFGKTLTNDKGAKEVLVKGSVDGEIYATGEYTVKRFDQGVDLFKKPKPPPGMGGMGGMGGLGGMKGLENLPPEVRRQLEAQLRAQAH